MIRPCHMPGCKHSVRTGLRRYGKGTAGQPLADGEYCWRCRARMAERIKKPRKRNDQNTEDKNLPWLDR